MQASEAKTSSNGQALLGIGTEVLVLMETRPRRREPGDRCSLAQVWICALLACRLQGPARGR